MCYMFMKLTSGSIKISTGILSISYSSLLYCMQSSSSVNVEIVVFSFNKQHSMFNSEWIQFDAIFFNFYEINTSKKKLNITLDFSLETLIVVTPLFYPYAILKLNLVLLKILFVDLNVNKYYLLL